MQLIKMKNLLLFLSTGMVIAGCTSIRDVAARCYNMKDGTIIAAMLYDFPFEHGKIVATMPDGEKLEGEFVIAEHSAYHPRPQPPYPREAVKEQPDDWSIDYGFGQQAGAIPSGTATLAGNRGTVLEVVFYSVNTTYCYGDGVGKDNKGNRYRIYVGEIENIRTGANDSK